MTTPTACTETHFLSAGCVYCTARILSTKNLATVDLWFEHGVISRDVRDGYRHVWALSATRSKTYDHWLSLPDTDGGREFARVFGSILPSGRGYC